MTRDFPTITSPFRLVRLKTAPRLDHAFSPML